MGFSTPFIRRPVATSLLTLAIVLSGALAFGLLPVAPLPEVDFPYITVEAALPGASPETMATSVAMPLERALGRISGILEITSTSDLGGTQIVLQFDLGRDIDGAAREVQAAINTAMSVLPAGMPSPPSYRKVNPSDIPIMILALTSQTRTRGELYELAASVLGQKIAQINGVGQVFVGGSSLPAVRIDLNPDMLNHYGLSLDTVRQTIEAANTKEPKGSIEQGTQRWQINTNDQTLTAEALSPLVMHHSEGRIVRLADVAKVTDSMEDIASTGFLGDKPAVALVITLQAQANIIETIEGIRALLPELQAIAGPQVGVTVQNDRSTTIRASLKEAELTLIISVVLVVFVVFMFLRSARTTLIPSLVLPVSLVGTFAVMYFFGFSLNNLSLMALIIATGYVVDDAIVVLENIARHVEAGKPPLEAAIVGAREVGFTVLSMNIALVAIFLPLLLLGGISGRLFREFAVTLSAAVIISLVVSLTLTPMLCARFLQSNGHKKANTQSALHIFLVRYYRASLEWALQHSGWMLWALLASVLLSIYLFTVIPPTLFPAQDTGRIRGIMIADESISSQALQKKLQAFRQIVMADPAVDTVAGFTSGRSSSGSNSGTFFITLKSIGEREPITLVIARLREALRTVPGATLYMTAGQDFRLGSGGSNAQYELSLKSDDLDQLRAATRAVEQRLDAVPELEDVSSDQQENALQSLLVIDRDAAARYGVDIEMITAVLNNSFGQRQIATLYYPLTQRQIVMEVDEPYQRGPEAFAQVYLITTDAAKVPLSLLTKVVAGHAPLTVEHRDQFAATSVSFNLAPNVPLAKAQEAAMFAIEQLQLPRAVQTEFVGDADAVQQSESQTPVVILVALLSVYVVLGMLYESYLHPITILSTLPSAGVGALLALLISSTELSLIALIGMLLLIGIVMKNAILLIDFALDAQRTQGLSAREAILEASVIRFRPITMTSLCALLGAVPLLFGSSGDAALRQPLGVTIIGGILGSQLLTLYTTPVVYLYLERLRLWTLKHWRRVPVKTSELS